MTFRDLKFLEKNDIIKNNSDNQEIEIKLNSERFTIQNKPFWISDVAEHKKADIANKGA